MGSLRGHMRRWRSFLLALRPGFFPASVLPVLLGGILARRAGGVLHGPLLLLSLLAVVLVHASMNVLNDYFDYLNGTDNINASALPPFSGGSGLMQAGLLSPGETLVYGICLGAAGSIVGLVIVVKAGPLVLLIGLAGLLSGFFYSAPPLFFAGRGLGEAVVALDFGVLAVLGSWVVQGGAIRPEPVIAGLPLSFLIAGVLYMNEFPDMEADRRSAKLTLVVRLGRRRALRGFYLIVAGAFLSLLAAVYLGYLARPCLLGLLALVPAVRACLVLRRTGGRGRALLPGIRAAISAHMLCGVLLIAGELTAVFLG